MIHSAMFSSDFGTRAWHTVSDGTQQEMATLTGNTTSGYTATLTIGVAG